jgi:hypothetical protein
VEDCPNQPQQPEYGTDEQQLTQLDADVEEQQGQWNGVLGQADLP